MDNEHMMYVNLMDLDLNQEPMDPHLHSATTVESLLNELDTAQELVEERIRQLEGVSARERQRQERNSAEMTHFPTEMMVNVNNNNMGIIETTAENGKGCKRNGSHLVAKALEINSEMKKADKDGGSFYDCNICLDMAREPILTCCGHLFCWSCFYQVSNIDSIFKECPVCKGEVSESTVIPIYGNGGNERPCETESGFKIPPRPKAPRVESIRQQMVTRSLSHVPIEEALRRIRVSIGDMGFQTQQEEGGNGIRQVSRVLSESAASLSSLSSALSSVDRLVEDLETVISSRMSRNDTRTPSVIFGNPFNAALHVEPSSQSSDVSLDPYTGINLPVAPTYSARTRRSIVSRYTNARESRRRRLN